MSTVRLVRRLPAALSHSTSSPVLASLATRTTAKGALVSTNSRMASSASSAAGKNNWSAAQYLKFDSERTRAVHDLVARVPLPGGKLPATTDDDASPPLRIIDLGCGPGNSTAVLVQRFTGAHVSGVDASPNMIERARAALPDVDFALADLRTYAGQPTDDAPADLLLANAVFQWLRLPDRLPTVLRLLATQRPGGVFAYQVPDNKDEPSHRAMGEVGSGKAPGTSADDVWVPFLRDLSDRDPIETPETIYDALILHCTAVDVWHTAYYHALPGGVADIVEWLKGSGLQPFVNALPEGPVRDAYLDAYKTRLADFYKPRADGSVLIRYPRLFVVAVKK
ncbi:trans-aconitate 2-methyltransferase [Grosmannia clavigera kw1407]|uniref:Trans-aconitate 2-methyltransferase n=1 Tax=Grosmannia clavigera (strain kw1407 / UAMH 11150) TaxID=655863 RepID=F0XCS6_GROCL|nr:trans-aconitate 2-methyltransferase [Grosmannia clavigera kw1407]EFX04480.1 trans-aconitate 2-methyltransferase [Grosmannia clavigera kw1407]